MKINKINDEISVSEQIHVDDLKIIKDAGFNSIICNRPDNESADVIIAVCVTSFKA